MELRALVEHMRRLYGRRNRIFLSGLRERIDFLNLAVGDLQDAVRKDVDKDRLGIAITCVVSRIFCVVEHFYDLKFVEAMARKYPYDACSYCGCSPCACKERRGNAAMRTQSAQTQLVWSLRQWSLHFRRLYGEANHRRGIENILNRLFREVSEISGLQMRLPRLALTLAEIEDEFALECADALAWTIAIANELGVDLETEFLKRFGGNCRQCNCIPCECKQFSFTQVEWLELAV